MIVLTTFNLDDRAARAIRYGASGFLLTDTTPAQLRDGKLGLRDRVQIVVFAYEHGLA